MTSIPPPSQTGVPVSGGNGTYIAVGALLIAGIIALVAFKSCSGPDTKPIAMVPDAAPSAKPTVDTTRFDDVPPPPAPEDASVAPVTTHYVTGPAMNVCDVKACGGITSTELENGLNMVARQTRRKCYETALNNDPTLKGHVKLNLVIAINGQVCSAVVGSNDMASTTVGDCAARTFLASRLPSPKGGCVKVELPLAYVPAGQQ